MTKASDNPFPSILIEEATEPSAPSAGHQRLYIDSTSHHLMRTNSSGTETDIEAASGGVASDSIWDAAGDLVVGTGADTAAKLAKGNAGAHLSVIDGAVAWDAGTAFPGSPDTNDRFYRTDVRGGMEFQFDGTRWLSVPRFTVDENIISITADVFNQIVALPSDLPVYLTQWHIMAFVSATATWVIGLHTIDFDAATASLDTQSTAAQTGGKYYHYTKTLGTVVDTDNANSAGNITGLIIQWDEQSGTATFYGSVLIEYQLVAT